MLQVLHPDDFDGHKLLKQRMPQVKWTTGEHEYSRYGWVSLPFLPRNHSNPALTPHARCSFRKLIEDRSVDILQPDVMWLGGLTERECPGPVLAGCELLN